MTAGGRSSSISENVSLSCSLTNDDEKSISSFKRRAVTASLWFVWRIANRSMWFQLGEGEH